MCKILLSINPRHGEHILEGSKKYEFRKVRCRKDVDKILIYATAPQKKVVAEADIEDIIIDVPNAVWEKTKDFAGITYSFFESYYKGKSIAIAYKLRNVITFDKPLSLNDLGITNAPQSFIYLNTKD